MVAGGALVGFAFLTKQLQAFLVLPGFALVYLLAARCRGGAPGRGTGSSPWVRWSCPPGGGSRWSSCPASMRPYVGGSQTNSFLELTFGYNGLGRITGDETGGQSVAARGRRRSMWGSTGLARLFDGEIGGQIAWLLPAALVLGVAALVLAPARARTERAGPQVAAVARLAGRDRRSPSPSWPASSTPTTRSPWHRPSRPWSGSAARCCGAAASSWSRSRCSRRDLAITAAWACVLLGRSPTWLPWLRWVGSWRGLVGLSSRGRRSAARGRAAGRAGSCLGGRGRRSTGRGLLAGRPPTRCRRSRRRTPARSVTAGPAVSGGRGGFRGAAGGAGPGGLAGGQGFPGGQGGPGRQTGQGPGGGGPKGGRVRAAGHGPEAAGTGAVRLPVAPAASRRHGRAARRHGEDPGEALLERRPLHVGRRGGRVAERGRLPAADAACR